MPWRPLVTIASRFALANQLHLHYDRATIRQAMIFTIASKFCFQRLPEAALADAFGGRIQSNFPVKYVDEVPPVPNPAQTHDFPELLVDLLPQSRPIDTVSECVSGTNDTRSRNLLEIWNIT